MASATFPHHICGIPRTARGMASSFAAHLPINIEGMVGGAPAF
jgi:hypothetical protein